MRACWVVCIDWMLLGVYWFTRGWFRQVPLVCLLCVYTYFLIFLCFDIITLTLFARWACLVVGLIICVTGVDCGDFGVWKLGDFGVWRLGDFGVCVFGGLSFSRLDWDG